MIHDVHISDKKVIIQNFQESDITNDYLAWLNDKEVVKYSNQRFLTHDYETAINYLKSFKNTSNLFLAIRELENRIMIGTMTVYQATQHGVADVGIMIGNRQFRGRGLGIAAWNTVMNFLLNELKVRKITAGTIRSNKPMIGIMERTGMNCEALLPGQQLLDDVPEDVFLYAKYQ
jgi:[ribosomal protein S5]-alanine N-acetyltransferase